MNIGHKSLLAAGFMPLISLKQLFFYLIQFRKINTRNYQYNF